MAYSPSNKNPLVDLLKPSAAPLSNEGKHPYDISPIQQMLLETTSQEVNERSQAFAVAEQGAPEISGIGTYGLADTFKEAAVAGGQQLVGDVKTFSAIRDLITGDTIEAESKLGAAEALRQSSGEILSSLGEFETFLEEPDFDSFLTQVFKGVGQFTPMAVSSVASGFAGGAVATIGKGLLSQGSRKVTKDMMKELVQKQAMHKAGKGPALNANEKAILDAAYETVKKSGQYANYLNVAKAGIGKKAPSALDSFPAASVGFWAGAFGQEYVVGSSQALVEYDEAGYKLTKEEAKAALGLGIPQAVLGTLGERLFVGALFKRAAKDFVKTGDKIFGNYMKEMARGFGGGLIQGGTQEGLTELGQEELLIRQRLAIDPEYSAQEANLRRAESAFIGFWAGGARSAPTSAIANVFGLARSNIEDTNEIVAAFKEGKITLPTEPVGDLIRQTKSLLGKVDRDAVWIPFDGEMTDSQKAGYWAAILDALVRDGTITNETASRLQVIPDPDGKGMLIYDTKNPKSVQVARDGVANGFTEEYLARALKFTKIQDGSEAAAVVVRDKEGNVEWSQAVDMEDQTTLEEVKKRYAPQIKNEGWTVKAEDKNKVVQEREAKKAKVRSMVEDQETGEIIDSDEAIRDESGVAITEEEDLGTAIIDEFGEGTSLQSFPQEVVREEPTATELEAAKTEQDVIELRESKKPKFWGARSQDFLNYLQNEKEKTAYLKNRETLVNAFLDVLTPEQRAVWKRKGVDNLQNSLLEEFVRLSEANPRVPYEIVSAVDDTGEKGFQIYKTKTPDADVVNQTEAVDRRVKDAKRSGVLRATGARANAIKNGWSISHPTKVLDQKGEPKREAIDIGKIVELGIGIDRFNTGTSYDTTSSFITNALNAAILALKDEGYTLHFAGEPILRESLTRRGEVVDVFSPDIMAAALKVPLYKYQGNIISYEEAAAVMEEMQGASSRVLTMDQAKALGEGYKAGDLIPNDKTLTNMLEKAWTEQESRSEVEGGTGWAVQMALDEGKPVYFFDAKEGQWYEYNDSESKFVPMAEQPVLTKDYALVGSRLDPKKFTKEEIQIAQEAARDLINATAEDQGEVINVWSNDYNGYEALSNFARRPFKDVNGKQYYSVEHAYQSWKTGQFNETVYNDSRWKQGKVFKAKGKPKKDNDWNIKLMEKLMRSSFAANPEAMALLKKTGNAKLTHNNPSGKKDIWANQFPKLLEKIRGKKAWTVERRGVAKVETISRLTVSTLRSNPDKVYLFGDNLVGRGKGGQAIIRDEPNAVGIPTKKTPSMGNNAFFTDAEYDSNIKAIDEAFAKIPEGKTIVIPEDGLGTGRAKLKETAPKTFAYLENKLNELKKQQKKMFHFTFPENVKKIIEEGYDTSLAPIHKMTGQKNNKLAEDVLYFTKDADTWSTKNVYVGKGKGDTDFVYYDYEGKTKDGGWVTEKKAANRVNLAKVEAVIKEDARVLTIDSLAKLLSYSPGGRKEMLQSAIKKARADGYDVVNLKFVDEKNWEGIARKVDNQGNVVEVPDGMGKDNFKTISLKGGKDDYFVLNKEAIEMDSGYTNHSGGAKGIDTVGKIAGENVGHNQNHYYVEKNKTPQGNVSITEQEAKKADPKLRKANSTLGRKFPTKNNYVNNLLRRNFSQVDNAEAVFAIATFAKGSNMEKIAVVSSLLQTGFADRMAMDQESEVSQLEIVTQEAGIYGPAFKTKTVVDEDGNISVAELSVGEEEGLLSIYNLQYLGEKPDKGTGKNLSGLSRKGRPKAKVLFDPIIEEFFGSTMSFPGGGFISPASAQKGKSKSLVSELTRILRESFNYDKQLLILHPSQLDNDTSVLNKTLEKTADNGEITFNGEKIKVIDLIKNTTRQMERNGDLGKWVGLGDTDVIILNLPDNPSTQQIGKAVFTLGHELGHAIFNQVLDDSFANKVMRNKLMKAFETDKAKIGTQAYEGKYGFEEWFADKMGGWLIRESQVTKEPAKNAVDSFFKRLAKRVVDVFKKLDRMLQLRFSTNMAFDEYVSYLIDSYSVRQPSISRTQDAEIRNMVDEVADGIHDNHMPKPLRARIKNKAVQTLKTMGEMLPTDRRHWGVEYLLLPAHNVLKRVLERSGVDPAFADMIYSPSQSKAATGTLNGRISLMYMRLNELGKLAPKKKNGDPDIDAWGEILLEAERDTPIGQLSPEAKKVRQFLKDFFENNIEGKDELINFRENFYPRIIDMEALLDNKNGEQEKLIGVLMKHNKDVSKEQIVGAVMSLARENEINPDNPRDIVSEVSLGMAKERAELFKNVPNQDLRDIEVIKDPYVALVTYIQDMTKRIDYQERVTATVTQKDIRNAMKKADEIRQKNIGKKKGEKIKNHLGFLLNMREGQEVNGWQASEVYLSRIKDPREQAKARQSVRSMLGNVSNITNPLLRQANSFFLAFNVVTMLTFAALASLPDLGGTVLRSKDFGAIKTFGQQMRKYFNNREEARAFARDVGVVSFDSLSTMYLNAHELGFMGNWSKFATEKFFIATGLEAYTKFTRVFAAGMAEQFLLRKAGDDSDIATRHLEELQVTRKDIRKWVEDGRSFETAEGEKVRAAIARFTDEAIVRPNSAERPGWASSPHFALVWQLKSFFYAYGKNIIGGALRESRNRFSEDGKLTSAAIPLVLGATALLPLTMLGLEIRELIKYFGRGMDPAVFRSDNMTWPQYTGEIIDRSGALGAFGLIIPMLDAGKYGGQWWVPPLGPTAERVEKLMNGKVRGKDFVPFYDLGAGELLGL